MTYYVNTYTIMVIQLDVMYLTLIHVDTLIAQLSCLQMHICSGLHGIERSMLLTKWHCRQGK